MFFCKKVDLKEKGKALNNQGFTFMELVIVMAIMAVVLGLAAVGINGYFQVAEQLERSEIAETSFYSLQSHINYLERQGKLEAFEEELKNYNQNEYGSVNILRESENRRIVELSYAGADAASFYNSEYYPAHERSEIIYIAIDRDRENKKQNPIYAVLAAALQNEDAMKNSFLVEYDLSTGVVRSVFYSESVDRLSFHFAAADSALRDDYTDCILRDADSLSQKKQGYYGVIFTSAEYEEKVETVVVPSEMTLVNGDRLYLTWAEENVNNPSFINGTYQLEALNYIVKLYDQDSTLIATYDMARTEMYQDITGTEAGVLNYLDDYATPLADETEGSTKTARIGYADLAYEEAPDGVAAQRYYMLLECLDHPFGENGYQFDGDDTLYATLEMVYGEEGMPTGEMITSNTESVYYAHVEDEVGVQEFGIGCARHLWNIRNGFYDGNYRLIADVDWSNIEDRGRDISFTSTQFADKSVVGLYHSFEGSFTGKKSEEDGTLYSCYRISNVNIIEEGNEQVGLFTVNIGSIENVILFDFDVTGAKQVGSLAGVNVGTVEQVCVLNTTATGEEQIGGLVGRNEGKISGCTVTTGANEVSGIRYIGGVVGYGKGEIIDTAAAVRVEAILPEGTGKISVNKYGYYIGGVIGYAEAGINVSNLSSGVTVDSTTGMPLASGSTGEMLRSEVTGIQSVGGVIGEIQENAGTLEDMYNYAMLSVIYIDAQEREERGEATTRVYLYYGGITGRVLEGNTLRNCVNYAPVALRFVKDGAVPDVVELNTYQSEYPANAYHWNMPRFIGGITGHNKGVVEDCITLCTEYGSFAEEAAAYDKVIAEEETCYVGGYVGGLIGYQEGTLLLTEQLSDGREKVDTMQVVVRAFGFANGGLVGYAKSGSIVCEKEQLIIQGVVASRGLAAAQSQQPYECCGGVVGFVATGVNIAGVYANESNIMGKNAGGIAGYLGEGVTLTECSNSGVVYGRGMNQGINGGVGGIAGKSYATLIECTNTGSVTSDSALEAVVNDNTIIAHTNFYGGIVGENMGSVQNCHVKRNADQTNVIVGYNTSYVGGMIGYNRYDGTNYFGTLVHTGREEVNIPIVIGGRRAVNTPLVGGIVGSASGVFELKDYTYSGSILVKCAKTNSSGGTGGIMGALAKSQSISGCVMVGAIQSESYRTGGIVGHMSGGVIEGSCQVSKEALIVGNSYTGGVVGWHAVSVNTIDSHVDIMCNEAQITGNNYVGGIAGYVTNAGSFDMSNRSNSGNITGVENVGGLVGYYSVNSAIDRLNQCNNSGEITGKKGVGGCFGTLTIQSNHTGYTMTEVVNTGNLRGDTVASRWFGGVAGKASGVLRLVDCSNQGDVMPLNEECRVSYAGGVLGYAITKQLSMEACANEGSMTAGSYAGGIMGYVDSSAGVVEISECVNKANIVCTSVGAGGIVGHAASNTVANCGSIHIQNCENYGALDAPRHIGGMLGYSTINSLYIMACENYGPIGLYADGRWNSYLAGGIVGYANTTAAIPESVITDCTQNASFYSVGKSYNGAPGSDYGIGGIIGRAKLPMSIVNCNYGDQKMSHEISFADTGASCIGGIVGSASSYHLKLKNCDSNVDITGKGKISYCGGLIGGATRLVADVGLQIGEKNKEETYCHAYGEIDAEDVMNGIGGAVGYLSMTPVYGIYGSTYSGDIGKSAPYVSNSGGILGYNTQDQSSERTENEMGVLEVCTNYGRIYNAYSCVGGILGRGQYQCLSLVNCVNGSTADASCGVIYGRVQSEVPRDVGGLIGSLSDAATNPYDRSCTLTSCFNYGNLYFDHTKTLTSGGAVGGLVGSSRIILIMGENGSTEKACANYGDIYGSVTSGLLNVGGIVGYGIYGGELYLYDAVNYGSLGEGMNYIANAGGILGMSCMEGELVACRNRGSVVNSNNSISGGYGTGGIVGAATNGSLILSCCVSGDKEDATVGYLEPADKVGGIIGTVRLHAVEVLITGCTNHVDFVCEKSVTYLGGIVSMQGESSSLQIQNTVNYGDIVGVGADVSVQRAGGILGGAYAANTGVLEIGVAEDNQADMTLACRNYGALSMEEGATGVYVGGFVGGTQNMKRVEIYGAVNEADFVAGEDSMLSCVGGIAGDLHNSGDIVLMDCQQNGSITGAAYCHMGTSTNGGAGGIAARLYGNVSLIRCNNGSAQAREAGDTDGQMQAVSWYSGNSTKGPQYMAGIVGSVYNTLYMQDCNNYGDILLDCTEAIDNASGYNGGIIGYALSSDKCEVEQKVILSCTNYGDLRANGMLYRTGGILGSSGTTNDGYIRLGDAQDVALQCVNYGGLYFDGMEISYHLGGLVGAAERGIFIYNGINYGDIGERDRGLVAGAGGIIGSLGGFYYEGENRIADCVQLGNIRQIYRRKFSDAGANLNNEGSGTAGIVGTIYGHNLTIENCVNGSPTDATRGNLELLDGVAAVGGIVGFARGRETGSTTLISCVNYVDIVSPGSLSSAGGLVGYGSNILVGVEGDLASRNMNYGNIYGEGKESMIGGIVGYLGANSGVFECINSGEKVALGKEGGSNIAGIVGKAYGANVVISGAVNQADLLAEAADDETFSYIGGILGNSAAQTIENCINRGQIGHAAYCGNADGANSSSIGGIAGNISGIAKTVPCEVRNCNNLGRIYVGNLYVGGIVGQIGDDGNNTLIMGCVNGQEGDDLAGAISLENSNKASRYIGGIVGYARRHNYYKNISIADCVNYGDVTLTDGEYNSYIGGVMGAIYSSNGTMSLNITRCKNFGDLSNFYHATGGIYGRNYSGGESYSIAYCENHGVLTPGDVGVGEHISGEMGGIVGNLNKNSEVIHCINTGEVISDHKYSGGIAGYFGSGYMLDCYQLGTVTGKSAKELAGAVGENATGFLIDSYSIYAGKALCPAVDTTTIIGQHMFWQATNAGGVQGYLDESAYNMLCVAFGITPSWQADDMLANARYLVENYTYSPSAPTANSFAYVPGDEAVEGSVSVITWKNERKNYFVAAGMELYLYDSTLTDAEILADTEGGLAYFMGTVSYGNGLIPANGQIPIAEVPEEKITYKVVTRTLGYSFNETAITTDTEKVILGIVEIPEEVDDTTVSGGDASVSGGDAGQSKTVSDGDAA